MSSFTLPVSDKISQADWDEIWKEKEVEQERHNNDHEDDGA